ncbi:MAG: NAD(P)/FAD-dependent oxidoreductase [Tenuifilaceae bacterium]|jgi:predicted Rossmann fold flavoprotein|nr:NAD(P)/FAD-dependent oxidoreductase [Tenuifilaceae bacterium]
MDNFDVVVVGGGPAGLLAAGKAAADGAKVLLLEKMEKPARKLRITGKGRCNITNTKPYDEFVLDIFPEPRFLRDAFYSFSNSDIVQLLHDQGVETLEERGKRVFPVSGKAWDVAEALVKWARSKGVAIVCHAVAEKVNIENSRIVSVDYSVKGAAAKVNCAAVILATGGKSYPATGSTGDGYRFAVDCGHSVTPLLPALVGVETAPAFNFPKGLSLKNVNLALFIEGKKVDEEFGDMELTDYGFDGPIVLRLSRRIIFALLKGSKVELELDLKPALNHSKLETRLLREAEENPRIAITDLARRLLPKGLADEMVDQIGLAAQKNLARLTADERKAIRIWLKEQRFAVVSQRLWNEAIVTAGGVSLKEVNPKTMESKIVKGLFFAGELLDLDGSTGGYNLQIAYSTGWLAGKGAAAG